MTRWARVQSVAVHWSRGFALRSARAGSLRRVSGNEAHFARGSCAHDLMAAGLMLTSRWNFCCVSGQALGMGPPAYSEAL